MRKLLIATNNEGKIREYKEIFGQLEIPVDLVSLKELNIKEKIEETGKTFGENAVQKAEFYGKLSGLPTLADDGGLEIDYLNGEPGVKSRRWPGYEASDEELVNIVLKKLEGVLENKRKASLRIVLALFIPNLKSYSFEAKLRGIITETPYKKLIPGYPFRAIFYLPEFKKVYGEIDFKEEAEIGHRRKAVEEALPIIKKYLC